MYYFPLPHQTCHVENYIPFPFVNALLISISSCPSVSALQDFFIFHTLSHLSTANPIHPLPDSSFHPTTVLFIFRFLLPSPRPSSLFPPFLPADVIKRPRLSLVRGGEGKERKEGEGEEREGGKITNGSQFLCVVRGKTRSRRRLGGG